MSKGLFYVFILVGLIATAGLAGQARAEQPQTKTAIFAGGCFWCMEPPFEKLDGVVEVVSGYTGGDVKNPVYKQVSAGGTGHRESVRIVYDPKRVSYEKLLEVFWMQINPTDAGGQFVDRGFQYTSAIFYTDEAQRVAAERSKASMDASGRFDSPIVTPIVKAGEFYDAEEYHQDYYKKRKLRYKYYRGGSGRDDYLEKVWDPNRVIKPGAGMDKSGKSKKLEGFMKPDDSTLRATLTPLQYEVTQEEGTERPFANEYWDNTEPGIYVDIVSGEPLFSSMDKYKSGTGWPSFTRPLEPGNIVERDDRRLIFKRTEVRSKHGDSHLGHVFDDGPPPTGLRYCMNSAALRFVPADKLEEEGYGEYKELFEK